MRTVRSPLPRQGNAAAVAAAAGAVTVVAGPIVLIGWQLDLACLKSIIPGLPAMAPNTAVGLAIAGALLFVLRKPSPGRLGRFLAFVGGGGVALIGLLTVGEYLLGQDLGIDLLFASPREHPVPVRPGFHSALVLVLLGLALLLLDYHPRISQILAVLATLVGLLALIGHACGVASFIGRFSFWPSSGTALPTAVLTVLLGAGVVCARPSHGLMAILLSRGAGGVVARRLLLTPVLVPLALGSLQLAAARAGIYDPEMGSWLFALFNIVIFTAIIWWCASNLYRADAERARSAEELHRTSLRMEAANRELRASQDELVAAKAQVEQYARRMEGQARMSENKYQRLMEQASDAILLFDAAGTVLEVNRRAEELMGRRAAEVLGCIYLDVIPPSDHGEAMAQFERLQTEGFVSGASIRFGNRDGRPVFVDFTASVVDLDGGPVILAIFHDVTERDRLERQLHHAQKLEAVGSLAGGVAHDFNNFLTVINGYSEVLMASLPPDHPAREPLHEMRKAGDRAAGLTHQLLAFARKQPVEPRVLDLNAVVADVSKLLRRLIGENVALASALDPALQRVKADPGQVEQVLMNLAINARDAMPTGGQLTVETRNVELDATYARSHAEARPGPYVLLAVSDTGHGMSAEVKAHLFEPFFTTKEPGKGTGLGLATVYGIVKQAGGHVAVESEVGRGSTITVLLPAIRAEAVTPAPVAELVAPRGTETILLVEDEDGVRGLARLILEVHGYDVLAAATGAEALQAVDSHAGPIALLVTDVVMPALGGQDLADALRARRPGIRVLYMSGYTDDALPGRLAHGAERAFLQKPFTASALAWKVREVLDSAPAV